ncbi:MAG: expansin EXLX1 family cellulose-binding protein [Candidatus Promineifilaceae bacterium]
MNRNSQLNPSNRWTKSAVFLLIPTIIITILAAVNHHPIMAGSDPLTYLPYVTGDGPGTGGSDIIPFGPTFNGDGTYYYGDGSGACLFPPLPNNLLYAAMNYPQFGNSDYCGAYINITGPQGSVIVRIVDMCPECQYGDIDMSPQAFAQIAEIPQGRVPISWQQVSYPLDGPIVYHFKDGSNQWWTAVQIRNHRNPIAKFEYKNSNGNWINVPRTTYNYFVESSGMGPGPYTFRVTDVFGHTLVDSGIPHVENGDVPGSSQFPPPP